MGKLFGKPVEELKFGIAPGSHVAHILGEKEKGTELFTKEMSELEAGFDGVSKEEIFTNGSEKKTKEVFMDLATKADRDYDEIEEMVPEMSAVLFHLKDYVTASGRAQQQNALHAYQTRSAILMQKMEQRIQEFEKTENFTPNQIDEMEMCNKTLSSLKAYQEIFTKQLSGNLQVEWHETSIQEPKDVVLGRIGKWTKSNDVLFPHIPSPNDVKQGHSIFDCYVMTVLSRLAEADPQQIMDMMKDNNDGTVSVRFYAKDEKGNNPKPVIVTVNKTVNQDAFGHNNYASSSLWVQMMEKAYVKYNEVYIAPLTQKKLNLARKDLAAIDPLKKNDVRRKKDEIKNLEKDLAKQKGGMDSIWVGYSDDFMNAISPKNHIQPEVPLRLGYKMYKIDSEGKYVNHPNYYLPEEKQAFEVLKKYINEKKEIVTAVPDRLVFNNTFMPGFGQEFLNNENPKTVTRDSGLRPAHIYGINKVFEKDGKMFVQIRDPYAMFTGVYKDGKLVKDNHEIKGTINAGVENMGTTNLEIKDFLRNFQNFTCASEEMATEMSKIDTKGRDYLQYPLTQYEMQHELPQLHEFIVNNNAYLMSPKYNQDKRIPFPADQFTPEQLPPEGYFPKEVYEPVTLKQPPKEPTKGSPTVVASQEKAEPTKTEPQKVSVSVEELKTNPDFQQDQKLIDSFNKKANEASLDTVLKNPVALIALTSHLQQAADDLRSTDEFFVWTNTEKFNAMRDALYDLNKDMKSLASQQKENTPENRKAVANKINELQKLSQEYVDNKQKSIMDNCAKGKVPSERAMLRMVAGINVINLCSLQKPMSAWPTKKDERLRTVENDIKMQLKNPGQIPEDKRQRFEKALEQFKARKKASEPKAKTPKASEATKVKETKKEKGGLSTH